MRKKLLYGFGGLSYSIISQTVSTFFMFYATTVLKLSGTIVGVIVAVSTIWDGISDTIVGFFSDNYPIGRLGKRNGYMFIATIGMAICNLTLWCVPNNISVILKSVWLLASLILLETFNTMFATPYYALGNELAESKDDRTKINASSTIFYLIGIIIPSALMLIFLKDTEEYPIGQLNPNGYVMIAIVTSIICFLFGMICALGVKNRNLDKITTKDKFSIKTLFANFLLSFKDRTLRRIIFGYVCTSIATVFLCSVGLHFFTYSLFYNSTQITILLLMLIVGTIVSQPLWVKISARIFLQNSLLLIASL